MAIEKIGASNIVANAQSFKGENEVKEHSHREHSDNNGAKYFAVAASIAAVAVAGIALKSRSNLKTVTEEKNAITAELQKIKNRAAKVAARKNKEAEINLTKEIKPYINISKVTDADEIITNAEIANKNSRGLKHILKKQMLTGVFNSNEPAISRNELLEKMTKAEEEKEQAIRSGLINDHYKGHVGD